MASAAKKEKKPSATREDESDIRARTELLTLESTLAWFIESDRLGVIYAAEDLGVYQPTIDYSKKPGKKMVYTAQISTCLECMNGHVYFGRKEFKTLQAAVNWIEKTLLEVLEEMATSFGKELY